MQLRCPENNCPIEVPDDLIGTRIRCPHCASMLTVQGPAKSVSGIQSTTPKMSLDAAKKPAKDTVNLEHQIYDGLPPLSVMMALRKQQGAAFDADDFAERYPMTEDDWKALSAFESVLWSVMNIRTTIVLAAIAALLHFVAMYTLANEDRTRFMFRGLSLVLLGGLVGLVFYGSNALKRINLCIEAKTLPWAAFGITLIVVANTIMNVLTIKESGNNTTEPAFALLLAIPINLLAAFDSMRSAWRVDRSLAAVSPPEISHRLTEAIKYLE